MIEVSIVGAGEAANDAVLGSYQMVRHPLNTIQGIANLGTQGGQIDAMVNISTNYVECRSEYGESFTNARYVSYGATSVAIAIAGPKYVRGGKVVTQAAKGVKNLTKAELKSISSLKGQIVKHEAKLAEYIKDPMKFDNKGFLKNAPNDAVRQKIIQSRVKHLNQEIQTFKNNIKKILNGE